MANAQPLVVNHIKGSLAIAFNGNLVNKSELRTCLEMQGSIFHSSGDTEVIAYEIIKDRENLEEQFGRIVRGMAYPYGTYSDEVVRVLRECGVVYARTTKATREFGMPAEWLTLHPTCHHNDPTLPDLTKKFIETTIHSDQHPWMFYLWGHAYEFVRDNSWHIIEEFAKQISGKEDIWYATNIEIWEYTENFKKLVFSLDERYVYNPTAQTLYFKLNRKLYAVAPGQTIQTEV